MTFKIIKFAQIAKKKFSKQLRLLVVTVSMA